MLCCKKKDDISTLEIKRYHIKQNRARTTTWRSIQSFLIDMTLPHHNPKGIGWFVSTLFLVDDLAGGGLVALPKAMVQTDFYLGFALFLVMMVVTTYTAYILGLSWNILLNTWPDYRTHCRKPYASIAYRALGENARKCVSFIADVTQFGISTVYLLLSSKSIHDIVKTFTGKEFSYCFVILIVAICLLPVTFLKSPQDFWGVVMAAMFTTGTAVVLIIIGIAFDYELCSGYKGEPPYRIKNFFLAFGTIIFATGGHSAFPTIQHDMRDPRKYSKSVIIAFGILLFMYGPISILGCLTYHDSVRDSILPSIQTVWIQQTCNILITLHCILTVTIVINPLNQDVEDLFHCPHHFGWQRILVRTGTMLAVVFVGESIPNFGPLLDFIGGSTITLSAIIAPCLVYVYLVAGQIKAQESGLKDDSYSPASLKDHGQIYHVSNYAHVLSALAVYLEALHPDGFGGVVARMVIGIIGGVAATFSAIVEITSSNFLLPCYLTPFIQEKHPADNVASLYCCGPYQNITHTGQTAMCAPMARDSLY